MPDLGPHASFIIAAYGVTVVAVVALVLAILEDDRRQRRLLAELERRGIRRRSAKPPAAKPAVAEPHERTPLKPKSTGARKGKPSRARKPQQ